jgi:hypothetical protein
MTQKNDYQGSVNPLFSQTIVYNAKGQVTSDTVVKVRGGVTYTTAHAHDYVDTNGNYYLGSIARTETTSSQTGATTQQVETTYGYVWREGAQQSTISKKLVGQSVSNTTSVSSYNAFGQLTGATITDGRSRSVAFTLDENGSVILRSEQDTNTSLGDPKEVWYFFNGRQVGMVGNNGVRGSDYAASIAARDQEQNTVVQPFRSGNLGVDQADFAGGYEPITTYYQGSSGGSYTVKAGDSLRSIALMIWGDADLWYKLAEANGLSGDSGLVEGQVLMLPAGVIRSSLNAGTITPYDPGKAIGDLSPAAPVPPPPAPQAQATGKKGGGCGIIGKILIAVVAVAVAVALPSLIPALAPSAFGGGVGGAIVSGAISGAAGSVVSQGVGVATGIQEKFSWKGVALSAIAGGVGGGVGASGVFGKVSDGVFEAGKIGIRSGVVDAAVRGVASSGLGQGIGLATGLQSKFDFVGVAAAGVGAAAGYAAGRGLGVKPLQDTQSASNIANTALAGAAGAIANAATRSAIQGTSFGDGIIAAIPDVIGQAVGGALGNAAGNAAVRARGPGAPENLLAGTPYGDVAMQQPGAQVAANPVEYLRLPSGESVAEALAFGGGFAPVSGGSDGSAYDMEILVLADPMLRSMISRDTLTDFQFEHGYLAAVGDEFEATLSQKYAAAGYARSLHSPSIVDTLSMSIPGIDSSLRNGRANVWTISSAAPPSLFGGYFSNVANLQHPARGQIAAGNQQLAAGSYLSGAGNLLVGSLGYYGSYVTGGFASLVSGLREGTPYANPRDLQDAALLEFAVGGMSAVARRGGLTVATKSGDTLLLERGVTDAGLRQSILDTGFNPAILSDASDFTLNRFDKLFQGSFDAGKAFRGRLGNLSTRARTIEQAAEIDRLGLTPDFETIVRLQSGGNRFVDVTGLDTAGNHASYFQLYRDTSMGTIPLREVDAANDIFLATGIRPVMVRTGP